jgi:hypothetical protein
LFASENKPNQPVNGYEHNRSNPSGKEYPSNQLLRGQILFDAGKVDAVLRSDAKASHEENGERESGHP